MKKIVLSLLIFGLCMGPSCAPAPDSGALIPPDDACQQGYSPAINAPATCCPDGLPYYSDGMCRATPPPVDGCPNDPQKMEPGVCGCGVPDTDSDHDGTPDCIDSGSGPAVTVEQIQASTWLVVALSEQSGMTGTSFAIGPRLFATNAHVVEGIVETVRYGDGEAGLFQHETGTLRNMIRLWTHPEYDSGSSVRLTPDVGLIEVDQDVTDFIALPPASSAIPFLSVFERIRLCGFPGNVTSNLDVFGLVTTGQFHPRVTCLQGVISALRPFDPGLPATPQNSCLIQYDLPVTPGTSGSAVFDENGQLIGVNFLRVGQDGDYTFAVRVDKLVELVEMVNSGSLPGTSMQDLMQVPVCDRQYQETTYGLAFDPPPGWFGPEPQDTSDSTFRVFEVYFFAPLSIDAALISASVSISSETNPDWWIEYQVSGGGTLVGYETFTTPLGDTGYYFAVQQTNGWYWVETHVYKSGYLYQLFSPIPPTMPAGLISTIRDSLLTLCAGKPHAAYRRKTNPEVDTEAVLAEHYEFCQSKARCLAGADE